MLTKNKNNQVQRSTKHLQVYRHVKAFLNRHKILKQKKIVAVSGGVDSMVLFFVLAEIAKQEQLEIPLPIYIAHQQRKQVDEKKDIELIQVLLQNYKLDLCVKQLNVSSQILSEEKLRSLRQKALLEYAKEEQSQCILSGHHLDDQIESFFIRLFSGTHFQGLSGMSEFSGKCFYKPFLNLSKQTLLSVAKDNGLLFNVDTSNLSTDFTRNHIRNVLLPLLSAQYGNKYKANVLEFMQDCKDVTQYLAMDLNHMLALSALQEEEFLREPLLKFSDLQIKFFLNYVFNKKDKSLNGDQLNKMLHLFRKGQGSYCLTNKTVYRVCEKKISIKHDACST
ncbi:MAG TPA: tRNA lysidine(34) synthetase TilS [Oligoflexia bacterium]|nr:tRNA lysidine(34) synthetase TilS [Oligoflexia bacterium]HMR24173.1 tRNA lysidine(34) synthetase TilS [Oligoflexia bacterium]